MPQPLDTPEKVLDAIAKVGEEPPLTLDQFQEVLKAMNRLGMTVLEVCKATAPQFAILGKALQCPKKGPRR